MPLSLTARQSVNAQESGEALIFLVQITHPDLETPIRLACDTSDVISNGVHYVSMLFDFTLPEVGADSVPAAQATIDNVSEDVMVVLRRLTSAPYMTVSLVLASTPDVVEVGPYYFKLVNVDVDVASIIGTLTGDPFLAEQYPTLSYVPGYFPALFGGQGAS